VLPNQANELKGPRHGSAALAATPLLSSRRGHLVLREFKSGRIRRCGCVRISFSQDFRLRLDGDLGIKSSCPAGDPQIFRVGGSEPDELRDFSLSIDGRVKFV
jgi:hypothetical protein